jgi:uncharacterized glyoxalase superfamily protein PhnB
VVKTAAEAFKFYTKAFDAEVTLYRSEKVYALVLMIRNSLLMIVDDFPEMCGINCDSPNLLRETSTLLNL